MAQASMVDSDDNLCKLCNTEVGDLKHRNSYPDGCARLAPHRDNVLSLEAKNFIIRHPRDTLTQHGWFMKRDLPNFDDLNGYAGEERWYYPNESHTFSGTTYVDGSCIPSRSCPGLSRGGFGVVQVEEQLHNSQRDTDESPDPVIPTCGCVNVTNKYHTCNLSCTERGCNSTCSR